MVTTIDVTKAVTSLKEAHELFDLSRASDEHFFTEWKSALPELTESESLAFFKPFLRH